MRMRQAAAQVFQQSDLDQVLCLSCGRHRRQALVRFGSSDLLSKPGSFNTLRGARGQEEDNDSDEAEKLISSWSSAPKRSPSSAAKAAGVGSNSKASGLSLSSFSAGDDGSAADISAISWTATATPKMSQVRTTNLAGSGPLDGGDAHRSPR